MYLKYRHIVSCFLGVSEFQADWKSLFILHNNLRQKHHSVPRIFRPDVVSPQHFRHHHLDLQHAKLLSNAIPERNKIHNELQWATLIPVNG